MNLFHLEINESNDLSKFTTFESKRNKYFKDLMFKNII